MIDIEGTVSATIKEVLGAEPPSKDQPLTDIGMDSIDALDLFYTLEDRFCINKLVDFGDKFDPTITQRKIEDKVRLLLNAVS
jgi:hypothetical protein